MLVGIVGKMGSGKTLVMTMLAGFFRLHNALSLPVYANYSLKDSLIVDSVKELLRIENGVVCLDEFWVSLDSRAWKNNVFLTWWINQTRKKNLLVLYTTQHFGQIDLRVRRATDMLIYCEKIKSLEAKQKVFRYSFIDSFSGRILKSFKIPSDKASNFFSLYNSFEIVRPLIGKGRL